MIVCAPDDHGCQPGDYERSTSNANLDSLSHAVIAGRLQKKKWGKENQEKAQFNSDKLSKEEHKRANLARELDYRKRDWNCGEHSATKSGASYERSEEGRSSTRKQFHFA